MSRNRGKQRHAAARAPQAPKGSNFPDGKAWSTGDSFANFEARTGYGTANQSSASGYQFDFISRNRIQLEAMYRSSWIVGKVVDAVAEDMTRAGIDIDADTDPKDTKKLTEAQERLRLWDQICDTIKWARLYGGALGVLLIDGQQMSTPLNVDSIGRGSFKGIHVLDRWLVQPSLTDVVTELGPSLGMPKFYDVVADGMALKRQRIHYSRVIRVDGVDLPYWQKITENLWGQSVVERLFDRLIAFDSTTAGAAQLIYKAHLRTYGVKGLRDIISTGGPAMEGLVKQIEMIRRYQSNEGLTLMDAEDVFETHQYAFSGLDNVLLQFGQQLSGATDMPLVRLFGQSPAGLNATGDSDMRMYDDMIRKEQERRLRAPLTTIMDVLHRSVLGRPPADGFGFTFNSLIQLTSTEKAAIAQQNTTTVLDAMDAGVIDRATALNELRKSGQVTGVWTNITDEMVAEAENDPPPIQETDPDAADPNNGPQERPEPGTNPKGRDAVRRTAA